VTARTSAGRGTEGISAFIVKRETKGFSVGKPEKKLGLHSSDSRPIYFDHCRVPANQRLGPEGEGFKYFMRTLDRGRIIIGSMALGLAEGARARARCSTRRSARPSGARSRTTRRSRSSSPTWRPGSRRRAT
jgi:alkylation response protein AidB-like acyl-CoA dehydrogenase